MTAGTIVAIVLAGGTSRRFGSDKLTHRVGGQTLLAEALTGLPAEAEIIVVGSSPTERPELRSVREHPVGGGPAAGLVTGLRAALDEAFDLVLVMPGDAPMAGRAASELLAALQAAPGSDAVLAVDATGREQPLQLALRPAAAEALVEAAGGQGGAGVSVRSLVATLDPPPLLHPFGDAAVFDIDTPDQLAAWLLRGSVVVERILAAVGGLAGRRPSSRPVVVAIDGPGAAGKSTLARALALRTDTVVIPGDDFYRGDPIRTAPPGSDGWSAGELVATLFDWRRLREEALGPLAEGRAATYRPYDWRVGDGRLTRPRRLEPRPLVVLEGVYSARPELGDLVDLSVYVDTETDRRQARGDARADDPADRQRWESAERFYFAQIRPPEAFDLVVAPELHLS